ncbi:glycosyltransferase [Amycolatopsis sacchari]|uniref:Glycosyltransferase, GT2 family n=1 Tax=Amycolatopsis sacchari TaxID=115433 RepID=A0A1I3SHS2_9PSEU|nr:glycosyltransferase [Amycolatopsis sacchari]SFJ57181.1 Glycosyltransferase, GT2 family [Amycolatopsis sacchari]
MDAGSPGEHLIEWTGERCVPWTDDHQVIYEHYHRYAFALRYVAGKRVLDLASGEGYGAALLAEPAAAVVGLEIDPLTVEHASRRYGSDKLSFAVGSIEDVDALPGAAPFDVITCFEAIEHVEHQDLVLRLVRRLLAPGGVFLCSTPDVEVYTHDHGNENPFHVRELDEHGFRELLGSAFPHVAMLRQNVAVGSLIVGDGPGADLHTLQQSSADDWRVREGVPHTYFLAVASDEPVEVPGTSVLADEKLTLVARALAGRAAAAAEADRAAERAQRLEADLAAKSARAEQLAADLTDAARERDAAQELLRQVRRAHTALAGELDRERRKAEHDLARLSWLDETNGRLRQTVHELSTENARLREEVSALGQRLISKYRASIERYAPRGTRRRDVYERALGRPAGVLPGVAPEPGPVAVTTSEQPIVSVVIPVYGHWDYTRRCLESIELSRPRTPFEVIVVDDASVDDSADRVAACPGVRLVRAPRNLGFIGACNLGAEHARGELVMFLNNDTEVRPGWLDELVSVLEDREDVGLVGSKLVYPDGRVQESGGIIWADGTGWNYGRNEPERPWFDTVRDVDYCSGAALLIRRELFDRLGGFDQRYAPAYYEDTDLAFAVRAAGYRTVVQPASVVVHHEGVSNGTDLSSGVKRHQELNRQVFVDKWSGQLAKHLPEASPRNVWLARQRTAAGHGGGFVLVADHQVPRPDEDSGSVRMSRLLRQLTELGERVVFFPMNHALPERYTKPLHLGGVTVIAGEEHQQAFLREAGGALSLALLSRPQVAWQLLEQIRGVAPHCRIAYDTVDLHFLRLERQAELAAEEGRDDEAKSLRQRSRALREMELGLVRSTDITLTVSEVERDLLRELEPEADVAVLSNVHAVDETEAVPDGRSGILFVGSFDHTPNRDAATWLAREVVPLVREVRPDAVAHIVGSNPPPEILALAGDGVLVHGWVPELEPHYREARVVVAPLRYGAGVKGKVGEALACGVPVVATAIAAEGMHLEHGESVLVGATARELADHVLTLLGDDKTWLQLSERGKAAIQSQFGPEVARRTLEGLLG